MNLNDIELAVPEEHRQHMQRNQRNTVQVGINLTTRIKARKVKCDRGKGKKCMFDSVPHKCGLRMYPVC